MERTVKKRCMNTVDEVMVHDSLQRAHAWDIHGGAVGTGSLVLLWRMGAVPERCVERLLPGPLPPRQRAHNLSSFTSCLMKVTYVLRSFASSAASMPSFLLGEFCSSSARVKYFMPVRMEEAVLAARRSSVSGSWPRHSLSSLGLSLRGAAALGTVTTIGGDDEGGRPRASVTSSGQAHARRLTWCELGVGRFQATTTLP